MNERQVFLDALAENEDDVTTRLVYADWLDDRGEHEEADRQRKWPAAKKWLQEFARTSPEFGGYSDEGDWENDDLDDEYEKMYSPYPMLMYFLERHVDGEYHLYFDTPYGFDSYSEELWTNFEIVTGLKLVVVKLLDQFSTGFDLFRYQWALIHGSTPSFPSFISGRGFCV